VKRQKPHWLRRIVAVPALVYTALVFGWAIAHRLVGDGFWLLALINAFAAYLFAPLPLAALLALLARRRTAWIALALVALLFVSSFGGELTPPPPVVYAGMDTPALTVMTYNVRPSPPPSPRPNPT
jgi:vancomycin resistance protein VanJ